MREVIKVDHLLLAARRELTAAAAAAAAAAAPAAAGTVSYLPGKGSGFPLPIPGVLVRTARPAQEQRSLQWGNLRRGATGLWCSRMWPRGLRLNPLLGSVRVGNKYRTRVNGQCPYL